MGFRFPSGQVGKQVAFAPLLLLSLRDNSPGDNIKINIHEREMLSEIKYSRWKVGSKTLVVQLDGSLDSTTIELVKNKLNPFINNRIKNIVIDLGKVSYMDSAGLAFFIWLRCRVDELGLKIKVVKPGDFIFGLFKMVKFNLLFPTFNTIKEAIDSSK
ncbi:STAS domain-containing protein [Candidatus Riflebacteria bacterium]